MSRLTTLLTLLVLLSGCAALGLSGDEDSFILNERVAKAYANPEYTMKIGRAPLVMRTGRSVDTCAGYLAAGGFDAVAADVNSRITPRQYLVCDTLAALKDARPLADGDYRPEDYGEALAGRLDLLSFRSSLSKLAAPASPTLMAVEGPAIHLAEKGFMVDARDWVLSLEVVAVAHLDDNRQPDWLLWLVDESNAGMYRSYQLLEIRDVSPDGPLSAAKRTP